MTCRFTAETGWTPTSTVEPVLGWGAGQPDALGRAGWLMTFPLPWENPSCLWNTALTNKNRELTFYHQPSPTATDCWRNTASRRLGGQSKKSILVSTPPHLPVAQLTQERQLDSKMHYIIPWAWENRANEDSKAQNLSPLITEPSLAICSVSFLDE